MRRPIASLIAVALLALGCQGKIGELPYLEGKAERERPPTPPKCDDPGIKPSDVPIRRITDVQYNNTIAAIFNGRIQPSTKFPRTTKWAGYSTAPEANVVTALGAEEIMRAAEEVAAQAIVLLPEFLPCAPDADEACAQQFITNFGRRVFRRPLRSEEQTLLMGLYRDVAADTEFRVSIAIVLSAMLQMPAFLYLVEEGRPNVEVEPGIIPLSGFEIASRLAYLFTARPPDGTLLAAAEAGELDTVQGVEAHARRLLSDPAAVDVISSFSREWMQVDDFQVSDKDTTVFTEYDATLAASMSDEVDRYVAHVMRDLGGSLSALLTAQTTVVDQPLARLYGLGDQVSSGPGDWRVVSLDRAQRSGLLSRASVVARHAHAANTSPVKRGHLVRTRFLCNELPAPPPGAQTNVPEFPPNPTERDKSAVMVASEDCGGCHLLLNPIGIGFENFDALGRWRDQLGDGRAIDASGVVEGSAIGAFDGVADLSRALSESPAVHACYTEQWFEYAFGRAEELQDRCTVASVEERFVETGLSIPELLVQLTTTDAFRYRRTVEMQNRVP